MIKKIDVSQAKIGMHVYDLECGWVELTQKDQVDNIKNSGLKELYIDTVKGCDIGESPIIEQNIEVDFESIPLSFEVPGINKKVVLTDELLRATKVKNEAVQAVSKIMEDARLGKLKSLDHVESLVENIVSSVLCNKDALLGLMRIRKLDKYTFEHTVSASILLVAFGDSLALSDDEIMQVGIGGFLMDIGKSHTPQSILKKPGRLTDDEFNIMCKHVSYSKDIVEKMPNISDVTMNIVMEHHERIDGSGYPAGMQGGEISLYGQMAAIVDVYDALSVDRVYGTAVSSNTALKKLLKSDSQFNLELVQKFIHCIGIYPVGSLVALPNGLFAVVIESGCKGLLYPTIRVIFDSTKRQFVPPYDIDLSDQDEKGSVKIVGAVEPSKWRINPADFMEHTKYS